MAGRPAAGARRLNGAAAATMRHRNKRHPHVSPPAPAPVSRRVCRRSHPCLRADDDAQAESKPKTRGPRKPVVDVDTEEVGEDSLLGASTLAKLNVTRKADDVPAADDAAPATDAAAG